MFLLLCAGPLHTVQPQYWLQSHTNISHVHNQAALPVVLENCCRLDDLRSHRPQFHIWTVSLQSQHIECVQALQQLGVISQVPGVSAAVINNTTQQTMDTRGHCSSKREGGRRG